MTMIDRNRFRLPAFLLMLSVTAGCAMLRPGPEIRTPEGQLAGKPTNYQQILVQMTVGSHGETYLVWGASKEGDEWETRFSRSEDGGATWSGPLWFRKPTQGLFAEGFKLAVGPTGQVYLAWRERNASKSDIRILVTRSLDGGRHWDEAPRQLAAGDHLGFPYLQTGPDGAVYVAWLGGQEFNRILKVATSQDSGATFSPNPAQIEPTSSTSSGGIINPILASGGDGRVYVAWEESTKQGSETSIYLIRSEDHGRTWSEPILVRRPDTDAASAHAPRMAVAPNGQIYLIWEELEERTVKIEGRRRPVWPIDRMIHFTRSLDGGRTWLNQPIRLSRHDPTSPQRRRTVGAQVICDGRGHVYVMFLEGEGTNVQRLVVLHSADSGTTWDTPTELGRTSEVKGQLINAVLVHDGGGRLWVVWQEHAFGPRYGWFVLMNRSEDYGRQWADKAVIMSGPTEGQTAGRDLSAGVGENNLVLAAWDHGWQVRQPIVLTRSTDGGKNWSLRRLPLN